MRKDLFRKGEVLPVSLSINRWSIGGTRIPVDSRGLMRGNGIDPVLLEISFSGVARIPTSIGGM